ncbi:Arm DNA-binding domain-containing protein [Mycobacterium avium]|uniref:Arm DNA-binding domain-containing protein n=1 Tax=Mycobacterium avium TaxID=1764 RepID=UPI0007A0B03A
MATIEKYETASGVTLYRVRYRKTDNRQTDKRGFRTKKAAEAFANTVEVKKLTGEFIPETAGRITVSNDQNLWMSLGGAREKWAHLPEDDLKVQ